jgi:phytoene dehydrogenase-like protein
VVGAGFGGLTAGALLAKAGRSVLVVERHDRPGGYGHGFRRGRRRFDAGVHLVGGIGPPQIGESGRLPGRVLAALGIEAPLVELDPCYRVELPGLEITAPAGVEAFLETHCSAFPSEEKGLRTLLQECVELRAETERAAERSALRGGMRPGEDFPALLRYRRATLAQLLDAHLDDPDLKAAFAALWPYLGLPPSRASFLYFATMLLSYVADGASYCRGTFQTLAGLLASAIDDRGGEVLLRSTVRRIIVEGGRVAGVVLEHGQRIEAPVVISNADLRQTAFDLVGPGHLPARTLKRLAALEPSISAFVVYGAARLDFAASGVGHETFYYATSDHEAAWRRTLAGEPDWWTLTVPSLVDSALAPAGEQVFTITTLMPYAPAERWRRDKEAHTERLLAAADARIPGLREATVFAEGGTPRTMERYTRNSDGAIYGWALSPEQVGPGRPAAGMPVPGLFLAGHWARPGGGVYGVMDSGVEAVRAALDLPDRATLWSTLG